MRTELTWAAHNLIAHPLSEICYWLGKIIPPVGEFGTWIHDVTVPPHPKGEGRG